MDDDFLIQELRRIEDLARADNYIEAFRLLKDLTVKNPASPRIWNTSAYLHQREGDKQAAIADLSPSIALLNQEPHPFYTRGILFFQTGDYKKAVADFTKVIGLSEVYDSTYYLEGAYFFRADANLRLNNITDAMADCSHVRDEMRTWTDRQRTKEEILAECKVGRFSPEAKN